MPAFDAVASATGFTSTTTSLTFSHTCGASATLLVVTVGVGAQNLNDAGMTITATYNGVAMTDLSGQVHNNAQTFGFGQVFYLLNPTTGSAQNVVITRSGGSGVIDLLGNAISYSGATTPTVVTTATGQSGTPSSTQTIASGQMGGQLVEAGSTLSAPNRTSRFTYNLNGSSGGGNMAYQDTATTGAVAMSMSLVSDVWSATSFAIPEIVVTGPAFDAGSFDAGSFYTADVAGVDNPVSGVVAGTSTSSGSLAGRLALVGAVAATSALVGSIGVSQGLSGTVAVTSSASGAVSAQHPLGGTLAATTTTTGSPVADHPVAGSSAATTAVTGTPSSTQALAGSVAGVSATTGTIGLRAPLAGTTAATSATSGAPSSRQALTGTTAATSTTAGTFFEAGPQNYPLTGAVAATTGTSGAVTARHPLGGTVAAVSSAAGAVVRAAALAGAVESTAVTFGDFTVSLVLSGTVDAVSGTAGEFVPPVTQFQGRILSASLAIPTAAGSIAVPSATGDVVTHRMSARLSILRARGVIG